MNPQNTWMNGRIVPWEDSRIHVSTDAVLRGDTRRAGELHDRLIPAIEPALYRVMGRREHDHDDLVQASFEQIVMTLMRGRFARGCSLSTWASAVAAQASSSA